MVSVSYDPGRKHTDALISHTNLSSYKFPEQRRGFPAMSVVTFTQSEANRLFHFHWQIKALTTATFVVFPFFASKQEFRNPCLSSLGVIKITVCFFLLKFRSAGTTSRQVGESPTQPGRHRTFRGKSRLPMTTVTVRHRRPENRGASSTHQAPSGHECKYSINKSFLFITKQGSSGWCFRDILTAILRAQVFPQLQPC